VEQVCRTNDSALEAISWHGTNAGTESCRLRTCLRYNKLHHSRGDIAVLCFCAAGETTTRLTMVAITRSTDETSMIARRNCR
jgi:hypothetical protein